MDARVPDIAPMGMDDLLLWQLVEECSEVAQAVSKAQRFGMEEDGRGQFPKNRERIEAEVQDIHAMLDLLRERGVLDGSRDEDAIEAKKQKVLRFAALSCREGRVR